MGDSGDWSTSSNEAVQIRLHHKGADAKAHNVTFQPAFTYPIFGDEETIFGYKNLRIKLDFEADTLRPSTSVNFTEEYKAVGDTRPDEIDEKLAPFLPGLQDPVVRDTKPFQPPGELLHQYEVDGRTFGVWTSLLSNPATKQIVRNMQILVPMFIEGGVPIELDDPEWTISRWGVFLLYAIDPSPSQPTQSTYSFAGYCTTYRLYFVASEDNDHTSPDQTNNDTIPADPTTDNLSFFRTTYPSRERISQFVILPPYQASGHGSRLYTLMMKTFVADPSILTVTVEDPNESFDDMRDIADLVHLRRTTPAFCALALNTDVKLSPARTEKLPTASLLDTRAVEAVRGAAKIVDRQFKRLVEMHLLARIPPAHRSTSRITRRDKASDAHDRAYYFWRLLVKQRLTIFNRDALIQLPVDERIEKLEQTLEGVERDYVRLLELAERRQAREEAGEAAEREGAAEASARAKGSLGKPRAKKRVIEEDDDDDDGGDDDDGASVASKRQKVHGD